MSKEVIDKIKSTGYWKIRLHPSDEQLGEYIASTSLKDILSNISIDLRGWDYPHISQESIMRTSENKIACSFDWENHGKIEYWELSTNGLFEHILAMNEDYIRPEKIEEIKSWYHFGRENILEKTKLFEVMNTIYEITEILLFASRYSQLDSFKNIEDFKLTIELHGVNNRMLYIWDRWRNLHSPYTCHFENDLIVLEKEFTKKDIIGNFDEIAFNFIVKIFTDFGWESINTQMIKAEQDKLIKRNF